MSAPSATRASLSDYDRSIAALVTAFISDPFIRWMFPDAKQHLHYFPQVLKYFAGRAFDHGSAYRSEDFKAVALWLPPSVGPDEEALGAVMQEGVATDCRGRCSPYSSRQAHRIRRLRTGTCPPLVLSRCFKARITALRCLHGALKSVMVATLRPILRRQTRRIFLSMGVLGSRLWEKFRLAVHHR